MMYDQIIYTLSRLRVRGREDLRALVACKSALSAPEKPDGSTLRAVLAELDTIAVSGEDSARLLGCMQAIENLLEARDEAASS